MTAWLCLALVLLAGLNPSKGLVCCVESDGCVRIEFNGADGNCAPCEGHDDGDASGQSLAFGDSGSACPCVDIAVPGSLEDLVAPTQGGDVQVGVWIAARTEFRPDAFARASVRDWAPLECPPRIAPSLACIRCVVLLV